MRLSKYRAGRVKNSPASAVIVHGHRVSCDISESSAKPYGVDVTRRASSTLAMRSDDSVRWARVYVSSFGLFSSTFFSLAFKPDSSA